MKPLLWILVMTMISSLELWAQEGSKVLVDDRGARRGKFQQAPVTSMFTIDLRNPWVVDPTEPRSFAAAYLPPETITLTQKAAETGDPSSQARLALFYLNGVAPLTKSPLQAYQWALIAQANGELHSRHVLRELDLFLTQVQIGEARRMADEFLKKPRGPKN